MTGESNWVVGIDAHVVTGKYQGSRTWLEGVISHLAIQNPQYTYVLYSDDPARTERLCAHPNVKHRRISVRSRVGRLLFYWPLAARRDGLDVLLTQYIAPPFLRRRQVVVVHDILFESHPQFFPFVMRWRNRLLVRASVRIAAQLVTVSRFTREALVARYGIARERIHIAANAVAPRPNEAARLIDGPYLLFVGRIEPRKNLDLLLDAFHRLDYPGLRLVVVGYPDFRAEPTLRRLAGAPGVVHRCNVPDAELAALYRDAAALVFPSEGEGFGLPILEALTYGTRVVCADTTALPEVAGPFAHYFSPLGPGAVEDLARAIATALDAPSPQEQEGFAAHLAQFAWPLSARALGAALAP